MSKIKKIYILHGPNLNLLGARETNVYGQMTLDEINNACVKEGEKLGQIIDVMQSNHEGALVDAIHHARANHDAIIINPGAYTHTSIAIHDALLTFDGPIIEVHLSNIHKREEFRHHSYISKVATGAIVGLGHQGYILALHALANR